MNTVEHCAREYVRLREESVKARRARVEFLESNEEQFQCDEALADSLSDFGVEVKEGDRCFRVFGVEQIEHWCPVCKESHQFHLAYHDAVVKRQQAYRRLRRAVLNGATQ